MKKFLKGCGIAALIFLIIGILFTTIVYFTKGGYFIRDTIEDRLTKWGMHRSSEVLDTFVYEFENDRSLDISLGEEFFNVDDDVIFDDIHEIYNGTIEKEFSQKIDNLNIEVGGCQFKIRESADDTFRLEGKKVEKLQVYVEDRTLYLQSITRRINWKSNSKNCTITLWIPKGYEFDDANIAFGAADVELGNITARKVELDVGASDVRGNIIADEVNASVGAGQLRLEEMEITNLEVTADAGSFYGSGRLNGNAKVMCAAGNADLVLDADYEDYNYDIECVASTVTIGDRTYYSDKKINNDSVRSIELEVTVGAIDVLFQ